MSGNLHTRDVFKGIAAGLGLAVVSCALVSPGVVLIRRLSLPLVKKEAERRAATVPAAVAG